jgi:hypothetical protein
VRVNNFPDRKAAFEKALFVYPDAQEMLEDYFEVERRAALLAARLRRPPGNAVAASLLWGILVTALVASHIVLLAAVDDAHRGFLASGFHPVRPLGRALVGRRKLAVV